jgi:hypothetical protein
MKTPSKKLSNALEFYDPDMQHWRGTLAREFLVSSEHEALNSRPPVPDVKLDCRRNRWGKSIHKLPAAADKVTDEGSLAKEIERLRKKYAPFLENRVPELKPRRSSGFVTGWRFRYQERGDNRCTTHDSWAAVDLDEREWSPVPVSEFIGPPEPWTGWYRAQCRAPRARKDSRVFIRTGGFSVPVQLWVEGCFVKELRPFTPEDIEITTIARPGDPIRLALRTGRHNQDKPVGIRGRTWPGLAETTPGQPPCCDGIWRKISIECRDEAWVDEIYARPRPEAHCVDVEMRIKGTGRRTLEVQVLPRNFRGRASIVFSQEVDLGRFGHHTFPLTGESEGRQAYGKTPIAGEPHFVRCTLTIPAQRLWTTQTPYLYTVRARLMTGNKVSDHLDAVCGQRSFTMDQETDANGLRGTLRLNGNPVFLKGATDGSVERAAFFGDTEQIIDDLLLCKAAHFNCLRGEMGWEPHHDLGLHYCDMLGIMTQVDMFWGNVFTREQIDGMLERAATITRSCRNHPSVVIMMTLNEPYGQCMLQHTGDAWRAVRGEQVWDFLHAAYAVIHGEDPDRVVTPVDGLLPCGFDEHGYLPFGLPVIHCYFTWYAPFKGGNIEAFERGDVAGLKPGWKTVVTEMGAEGLDSWKSMEACYPRAWYPAAPDSAWDVKSIPLCQTATLYTHHFPKCTTASEWIEASQAHQAWALKEMTQAIRRRADRLMGYLVHPFVDAWPDRWLKAIVSNDRTVKRAYFALRRASAPVHVHLRTPVSQFAAGQRLGWEVWVANDYPHAVKGHRLQWFIQGMDGKQVLLAGAKKLRLGPNRAEMAGTLDWLIPKDAIGHGFTVRVSLLNDKGCAVSDDEHQFCVWDPHEVSMVSLPGSFRIAAIGEEAGLLEEAPWFRKHLIPAGGQEVLNQADLLILCGEVPASWTDRIRAFLRNGGRVLVLETKQSLRFLTPALRVKWLLNEWSQEKFPMRSNTFFADHGHPLFIGLEWTDLCYWGNLRKKRLDPPVERVFAPAGLGRKVTTLATAGLGDAVMAEFHAGKGRGLATTVKLLDRFRTHPVAGLLLRRMVEYLAQ